MYLNCHSQFSLRYGTLTEVQLLELAVQMGVGYMALTDINNTSATLNFLKNATKFPLWPVVGVDFRNGVEQQYVLLAKTNLGFQNINEFLSHHLHSNKEFPRTAPCLGDTFAIYPLENVMEDQRVQFRDNEYIGVSIKNLRKLPFTKYIEHTDKLVIQQQVTFRHRTDFNAHRLLRCIDLNTLLSKLPKSEEASPDAIMLPIERLSDSFADYPFIKENTKRVMQRCKVDFFFGDQRTNQNQEHHFGSKNADFEFLKKECYGRLPKRYPHMNDSILKRVVHELDSIKKMGFVFDFVANYLIVENARANNWPHIGRGSGANSVVAYILGITNVDPIELNLYFERFINPYRISPPDFDIDFSWRDRDSVTEFIFDTFGNVALMGTYVTFQYRAVVRELSKVFGMPKEQTDNFLAGRYVDPEKDKYLRLVRKYGKLIHGFPNYVSVHACGIVITERPVEYFSATFMPPKGFRTVMFDMNIAEDVGIFKFDILAQRGLSKIMDCLEIISYNQPNAVVEDIDNVYHFYRDQNLNDLLSTGDCIGGFYIESPAMRVLMTKLRTNDYLGLVAASSIIRPGPGNGGMKNEYILRHRFPKRRANAHPIMYDILRETYGVMVYQEDVLKVAHNFAGLTLAEADVLRRGMRGKTRTKGVLLRMKDKFKASCRRKGHPERTIDDIWDQVESFAGYAFAKGHSASYTVESYQSLYLKYYFPIEYMTAVLNNGGGFYRTETYVNEIRKYGGTILPPCVNTSDHPNIVIGKEVFLGFGMVKSIENNTTERLLSERQLNGKFKGLADFYDRVQIGVEQLVILIKVGAFRFTGIGKHSLMWEAYLKHQKGGKKPKAPTLFKTPHIEYDIPELETNFLIEAYDQLEFFGFPFMSRFKLLKCKPSSQLLANDLPNFDKQKITIYGNLVTFKGTNTKNGKLMYFGTFADANNMFFDTVHFPKVAEKYRFQSRGVYKIKGTVMEELGYYCIIVDQLHFQEIMPDPRSHLPENSNKSIV
ncbi:DNA-directed DNA polymerase [Flagellimonas maritima]|uniref:DNA polymerase III subunit alpha n=1 Tax=Flagellimonas maritima TaxID=1383885 RepID=A0A2Z4LSV5_9FLAO|nr:PHP domain-containing protein [Allomuricauda aurantiaca]AWX44809.1 DNA-directed DNA polymerase [Allomuricauda aurantiaca]